MYFAKSSFVTVLKSIIIFRLTLTVCKDVFYGQEWDCVCPTFTLNYIYFVSRMYTHTIIWMCLG